MRTRVLPGNLLGSVDHRPWTLPTGRWVQRQSWLEFPFLHWTVDPDLLRPLIPEEITLDTADGVGWVGIIPFRMEGVTLNGFPVVRGLSAFHELNVRTYVTVDGRPGVFFLSLDANNRIAVRLARRWFSLPYWDARQSSTVEGEHFAYRSERTHRGGGEARFEASWDVGGLRGPAKKDSIEHWLCERYALYVVRRGRVLRGDVHHLPWPLHDLQARVTENTMTGPLGFQTPGPPAHVMYSPGVDTVVWSLVSGSSGPEPGGRSGPRRGRSRG